MMIAEMPGGPVCGEVSDGVAIWRGIPYAAAPVGRLRFAPPEPARPWAEPRDATRNGPIAPQLPSRVYDALGAFDLPQDEDCLSLTIWRPASETLRPVIVWLHGGGFATGAGALPWYDGAALARRADAVVVGVNYRLGALGFLYDPRADQGNFAVLDQMLALRWVRDNIAGFGGDPSRITVMGQSGGAHNICMMLTLPQSEGLFHRAILLSPPLGAEPQTPAEAAQVAEAFHRALGADHEGAAQAPVADLLQAQTRTAIQLGRMAEGYLSPPLMPVRDKTFPIGPDSLAVTAAVAAAERGIAVMISWTTEEAKLFFWQDPTLSDLSAEEMEARLARLPGAVGAIAGVARRKPGLAPGEIFVEVAGDLCFRHPALAFADAMAARGGACKTVEFSTASPNPALGACHCAELPFVFGTWRGWTAAPLLAGIDRSEAEAITANVMGLVADFAIGRDTGLIDWHQERRMLTMVGKSKGEEKA